MAYSDIASLGAVYGKSKGDIPDYLPQIKILESHVDGINKGMYYRLDSMDNIYKVMNKERTYPIDLKVQIIFPQSALIANLGTSGAFCDAEQKVNVNIELGQKDIVDAIAEGVAKNSEKYKQRYKDLSKTEAKRNPFVPKNRESQTTLQKVGEQAYNMFFSNFTERKADVRSEYNHSSRVQKFGVEYLKKSMEISNFVNKNGKHKESVRRQGEKLQKALNTGGTIGYLSALNKIYKARDDMQAKAKQASKTSISKQLDTNAKSIPTDRVKNNYQEISR